MTKWTLSVVGLCVLGGALVAGRAAFAGAGGAAPQGGTAEAPHRCDTACDRAHGKGAKEAKGAQAAGPRGGPVRADAPALGPAGAPVTVEVWSDFQCPFCARGADRVKELRAHYGDRVRVVFRHLPLDFHPHARKAAEASMAAHAQGRFWELHDALFSDPAALGRGELEAHASRAGVDGPALRRALEAKTYAARVEEDVAEARARGISGTPTFFVNGAPLVGARPLEDFVAAVDAALAR
jgi:protein-disulfide isomerase